MRSDTLRVPGASLYYEVRGNGPLLLLIPGGGGDAAVVDPIADLLAEHFTVACLDPRGYSRSTLDSAEPQDQRVEVQSDDAYRLITHLTDEPAYVFGGSSGAIVGLDLLARHPERIRRLVAHEPPCFAILPDAEVQRAFVDEVYTLFRTEGLVAAGMRFLEGIGGTLKPMPAPADLPPRAAAMMARLQANSPIMMEHELRQFTSYVPDAEALAGVVDRLVLGSGRETGAHLPARPAAELATRLGVEVTEFPGGHSGFTDEPEAFAQLLLETLLAPVRS
ncbi:alpha/beta fold hydrolase [Nocardia sp. NBC_01327]|uniref:alpha/beta fold hydrolase n=1 Tax=Nocardia sp. NBC_01327 TaxID=2903593 RepID=UPI002E10B9F4|nr:alpha/beta hydrolase [Nocardia sp. NBC_01327]